jgi:alpha-L-fucosidase
MDWYLDARFGTSIHWGLYSIAGRGEWVRSLERLTVEQYQTYFDSSRPDLDCVVNWARLAKRAGSRYAILTTKHHDGFCLWDSKLTDYKSTRTPAARDFVREYVDALRAEGLKVGLYYSLVDWHHRDYPAYGDRQHPLRHDPASRQRDKKANWSRYVTYLHGQVEELLTRYGKIDLLAFDFSYWDFAGEKWGASDLLRKIRQWQPGILVNDRMGKESLKETSRPAFAGDFDHVEQNIPREPVTNRSGKPIPWDAWFTLNNHWSFNQNDHDFKPVSAIVRALVNCVSKGGNLTVNFSPDGRGRVSTEAAGILEGVGDWLERNGESIYGCGAAGFPKPEWGRFTQRDRTLYAHLLERVIGHVTLPNLRGRVKNGRVLATGAEAILCDFWNPGVQTFDRADDIFFNFDKPVAWTFPPPDPIDTVVRFDLTEEKERAALLKQYQREFKQAVRRLPF